MVHMERLVGEIEEAGGEGDSLIIDMAGTASG